MSETDRYNCTSDWLPDSRHVVYARGIIPQEGGRAEMWMAAGDGRERHMLYAEEGRHIYGACPSPDGRYLLFTRSVEDLGKVDQAGTTMAIIRAADAPIRGDAGESLRKRFPAAGSGPRLDLGPGWEPHWTFADAGTLYSGSASRDTGRDEERKKRDERMKPWLRKAILASILLASTWALVSCGKPSAGPAAKVDDPHLRTMGSVEVTARLVEVPEGAIFKRDLYNYATILKYEIVKVHRGQVHADTISWDTTIPGSRGPRRRTNASRRLAVI